ncbi:ATP-binding protein [uncultured Imperialibacter sp.]|uniref:ATP-binding protein n=1 Tax=uncultured Imperialibacter sp. TaxID=1672639 RepID=UPI0030D9E06C|tara:strand:+ start:144545 stop:145060 length:516 start_codon:yes stop_codon:yes gene_type:complete
MTKRIGIIGPESTGKSTLSLQLAAHFQTQWVPEFARQYLIDINRPYEESDLLTIAKGQKAKEEQLFRGANNFLFCDTTLIVVKVWSEHSYGRCDPWIAEQVDHMKYDYFFLTDIDMPWVEDPLREHPHMRDYFFDIYKSYLEKEGFPYSLVSGNEEERLQLAIAKVGSLIV